MTWERLFGNPIDRSPGRLVFRLADERGGWSSTEFAASTPEKLRDGIRRAWDERIRFLTRGAVDPAFAFRARAAEIRRWLADRERRQSTSEQCRSWESQADHWMYQATRMFGERGEELGLHVRSNLRDEWFTTTSGPVSAKPPRIVSVEDAAEWFSWAEKREAYDRRLEGFLGDVGGAIGDVMDQEERRRRRARFRVIK